MDTNIRGSKIIVRDFINRPLARVLWGIGDRCVYICSTEQFTDLLEGDASAPAIGFPIEDVFKWDDSYEQMLSNDPFDWSNLSELVST